MARVVRARARVLVTLAWLSAAVPAVAAERAAGLRPEDILSVTDIVSVALSPDGREVLYEARKADLESNRYMQAIWRVPADGSRPPERLTDSDKDRSPQWSPDGRRIAFLSSREGGNQVWVQEAAERRPSRLTTAAHGVTSFEWSPDGRSLAYLAPGGTESTFAGSIANDRQGTVVDKRDFAVYRLLRNEAFLDQQRLKHLWIVDTASGRARQVTTDRQVEGLSWSPDGRWLAFAATPDLPLFATASSVFLHEPATGRTRAVAPGAGGMDWDETVSYVGPLWSPDGRRLAVLEQRKKDRWSTLDRIALYSPETGRLDTLTGEESPELYRARLSWVEPGRIFVETTRRAERVLLAVSVADASVTPLVGGPGYNSDFAFSARGDRAAFVSQAYHRPPEVHVAEAPFLQARKVTDVNQALAGLALPRLRPVKWTSSGGAEIEGWLSEPRGAAPGTRSPLLVFVHGGPGVAVGNRFLPYPWPYPFQVFSDRGYAVFIPNYRGTGSYGKAYRSPSANEKEPVEDILSGIDALVAQGVADPERVGIMGQSHGCWLGALAMARRKTFRAASLAEGAVNYVSLYGHMPGWLNLNVHEYYQGGTPWENPERYRAISPIYHLDGVATPTLLEFGDQSLAMQGQEFATALWRRGIRHELVIYPKTGHNIAAPALELDSMRRNLEWFDWWMLGRKDPDRPATYQRWERMEAQMARMRAHPSAAR